jgi:endonuclease/exonuclease/phosphatase family metal-dependent hydrolase
MTGPRIGPGTGTGSGSDQLRVLHWNVRSWRDLSNESNVGAVADLIDEHEPHVVSLVEVDESWAGASGLPELLGRVPGYRSVFVPAFEYRRGGAGFGNAVLAGVPIRHVRQVQLVWPQPVYDGSEPSQQRTAVFVEIELPSGPWWVGSTHLPAGDRAACRSAFGRVVDLASALPEPWLLVGDFNLAATKAMELAPQLRVGPNPAEPTFPVGKPSECIDYCLAPRTVDVRAEVLANTGSDHHPLLCTVQNAG